VFLPQTKSDDIYVYRYIGDDYVSVLFPSSDKEIMGFYDTTKLDKKDKYSIFLGGNHDLVKIRKNNDASKRILILKDSFANSLVPFIARHFDIDMIDLRYYKGSVKNYIEENKFDAIFFVYGIDTLATDKSTIYISK
jgi:hypothetical protein